MQTTTPFYIKKLVEEFELRKSRRPDYSLRSYAKYLGIDVASLSNVLKGNRRIPKGSVSEVATRLNLSPQESEIFITSNKPAPKLNLKSMTAADVEKRKLDSEAHFRIISEWEHYAIMSLMDTRDFKSDLKWIAERLGSTELRIRTCIENLFEAELIRGDGDRIFLTHQGLATTEDIPSQALRKARKQDLELAMNAIEEINVELRDFSSSTMTVHLDDLQILKKTIREFRKKFMLQAERNKGSDVYKLNIQLLPLSKVRREQNVSN